MILIAGRYDFARDYAREHQLGRHGRDWCHIGRIEQFRGMEGPKRNPECGNTLIYVYAEPGYFNHEFHDMVQALGF